MTNVLIVSGSVRPNSAGKNVVPLVVEVVQEKGATATLADLKEINLPFFDAPLPPTAPGFEPTNDAARTWTKLVDDADAVILVTPEYNHTLTPVQINAIDWIGKEWNGKPVGMVGYGARSGAVQAQATAREALAVNLKAKVGDYQTNLLFAKDLNPDGTPIDPTTVKQKIAVTVDELLAAI